MLVPLAVVGFAVGLPAVARAQPGSTATAPLQVEIGPVTVCTIYPILWTEICV
jgi:hypothetical protein